MFSTFQAFKFLLYKLNAVNQHGLHSPFVYNFYHQVLKANTDFPAFKQIESYRQQLLQDSREIDIKDFGAGSRVTTSTRRKIKDIAKSGLSSSRFSKTMFHLCRFINAKSILELGTSFGINTTYLSLANPSSTVISFEGCPETVLVAQEILNEAKLANTTIIAGDIDDNLSGHLKQASPIDLVYMDANHTFEATIRYFDQITPHLAPEAVVVVDDIYWSVPMSRGWEVLKSRDEITTSIDIFDAGFLFFDKSLSKEHFTIDY